MHPMEIDRRCFAAGLASYVVNPICSSASASADETIFASNVRNRDGTYSAVTYSTRVGLLQQVRLPDRGHDLTYSAQSGMIVAFARRPGNFAVAFDIKRRWPPQKFTTPSGRHFYGHGVFSADSRLLYTTENDFENAAGIIGVYDVGAGFERIGEHLSYGVGPHDINLLNDGRTLVVANGGIETHPDSGRDQLNLATMRPSLTYVDCNTGDLLEHHETKFDLHKLSIRHLDVAARDTVVFGCQFKGPRSQQVELVGFHKRGKELIFLPTEPIISRALRHYVSSVAVDSRGEIAGITSSRGQQVIFVDVQKQSLIGIRSFSDVSGIAAHSSSGFILTGGHGDMAVAIMPSSTFVQAERARFQEDWGWDNHAIALNS